MKKFLSVLIAVCLLLVSVYAFAEETAGDEGYTVQFVTLERPEQYGETTYALCTAYDAAGNAVWSYNSGDIENLTELDPISEIGLNGDHYYLNESGSILCFDRETGTLLWQNSDFGGSLAMTGFAFGDDGTLYITGYYGPDLFAVDKDGNTLARVDSFDQSVYWPYDASLEGDLLTIYFENPMGDDPLTEVIDITTYTMVE